MIRNVLSHISGVELYGIVSILLFFAFFTGMLVWAFRLGRGHLEAMRQLPLNDDPPHSAANPNVIDSRHECE
jgi:cytochrome c oxidase cbb3-type subunit 4